MRVGAAQVNITPELPFFLAGSARLRVSQTVLDPLMASCVVIENSNTSVAFVSCDLINLKDDVVCAARIKVNEKTGIAIQNIILSATHTHQGPKTGLNMPAPWIKLDREMVEFIIDKIVSSVVEAKQNLTEARMGYDKGSVNKCCFNRRYIMSNGKSKYAIRGYNPDRLVPEGPVDKEVQTVWFEALDGKVIAVMVNFSCHPTALFGTEYVSADFPGAMRNVICSVIGKNVPILYLQGACGNINTVDIEDERTKCEGAAGAERIGRALGGEVLKLISQSNVSDKADIEIEVRNKVLKIPLRSIGQEEVAAAQEKWNEYTEDYKNDFNNFNEVYYTFSTLDLAEQIKMDPYCKVEISSVCLDDIIFVTNPVELFVEYQLEIKDRCKGKKVIVVELTNGHAGYVPTKLAFALEGYEMRRAISSKLDAQAGRIIVENSIELINQ